MRMRIQRGIRPSGWKPDGLTRSALWCWIGLGIFLFPGCTDESHQLGGGPLSGPSVGNRPPVIQRATIVPNPITLDGAVSVQIEADDPDRNALTFRHVWIVNGRKAEGQTKSTLDAGSLKRGDLVSAEIKAYDGQVEGLPFKVAPVAVGNTPPEIMKVVVEPTGPNRNRFRAVVEGRDLDQDPVTYSFRWRRNNTIVSEGEQAELDTGSYSRDDLITVEVRGRDQFAEGAPRSSEAIQLGNSAPVITSQPPDKFDKGVFSYQVQAIDDDRDPLKYELLRAPQDMSIDAASGLLVWQIGSAISGNHAVRVVVQDGHGGSASQDFNVSVTTPPS